MSFKRYGNSTKFKAPRTEENEGRVRGGNGKGEREIKRGSNEVLKLETGRKIITNKERVGGGKREWGKKKTG